MATTKELMIKETRTSLAKILDGAQGALPAGFNQTRFMQNCMTVLMDTKDIEKCSPISVARTLVKGAYLGLDFFQKECYAIPFGTSLQFITDYRGETKLAKKYSIREIKDIYAKVVREGDKFLERIEDGQQYVNFEPIPFNNGKMLGAFAVVLFKDGGMAYEVMTAEEIEGIRENFSKMKNGLMWTKTPSEAYKKTVLKRLTKTIEKDFGTIEALAAYNSEGEMDFTEGKVKQEAKDPFASDETTPENSAPIDVEFKEDGVAPGQTSLLDGKENK